VDGKIKKAPMVSLDGVAGVFRGNACIDRLYSLTWANVHVGHNHADGGEVGFGVDSKHLWKAKGVKSW
jgi:hypothetical protein